MAEILYLHITGAAKIAYELMLQEDFSHPTSYLLSLYSCVKHLYHTDSLERWEPAVIDPEAVSGEKMNTLLYI